MEYVNQQLEYSWLPTHTIKEFVSQQLEYSLLPTLTIKEFFL